MNVYECITARQWQSSNCHRQGWLSRPGCPRRWGTGWVWRPRPARWVRGRWSSWRTARWPWSRCSRPPADSLQLVDQAGQIQIQGQVELKLQDIANHFQPKPLCLKIKNVAILMPALIKNVAILIRASDWFGLDRVELWIEKNRCWYYKLYSQIPTVDICLLSEKRQYSCLDWHCRPY